MNVRIFRPSKSAMQSGRGKTAVWLLEPELESPRVAEPLMGWVSAQDTLSQLRLRFSSAEAAVAYARRQGWTYSLDEAQERSVTPRNYGDNFRRRQKAS